VAIALFLIWLVDLLRRSRLSAATAAGRYFRVLDEAPDLMLVVDPGRLTIEYANEAATTVDWHKESLVGRRIDSVVPAFAELAADPAGSEGLVAMKFLSETGHDVPAEIMVRSSDLPGLGPRLVLSVRDGRDRVEARSRLLRLAAAERARSAQLRAMVEAMDDPVCLLGVDGEAILANEAMREMIGSPDVTEERLGEALGLDGDALSPRDDHAPQLLSLQGGDRSVELRVLPVEVEGTDEPNRLIVLRDVSEIRRRLAAREAFIGVLSHELRTPVTTIMGLSKILARPSTHLDADERSELIRDIAAEAERMHRLVEDLLILSRTDGARLDFEQEPVLVQRAIAPIVAAEADRYPHIRFVTEVDPDLPPVAGDQTFVEQILRNLIGNAAKYSPTSPSEVRIVVRAVAAEVEITVLDHGPGFEPAEAERLFELFYRAAGAAVKPGAGIGLFVTRSLALAMGGRTWARPRPGGGAEFGAALPVMAIA
jgi:signal transduction histidine kinase